MPFILHFAKLRCGQVFFVRNIMDYIIVQWPSAVAKRAEIWRVYDLAGLTKSVRQSKGFTKAGFAYINGRKVRNLKDTVEIGTPFDLELRFPNGRVITERIQLSNKYYGVRQPRSNEPTTLHYRG